MNQTDETLPAMLAAYSRAVASKDLEAFLQLYDPSVRVFDAWDAWSYEGRDAWRECIQAWFAAGGAVQVRFEDVQTCNLGGFGTVTAIVTYASVAADGTQPREIQNRLTWNLRDRGGAWRIFHEHTSAPIRFGHSQPILRRGGESFAPSASS